ncbi:PfkB family carbohydrate kinase [Actinotignum sp. GS-2025c]|uniref:PfkB family carbohydrate kinase n=1 Tax=Actinotignum sp. GS-2025c TaxID=3427276 RepID=UPI003F4768BB
MMSNEAIIDLAKKLEAKTPHANIPVGYDGFIDRITHVVDKRLGPDEYQRVETLTAYGQKFIDAAGLSMNIEMVPVTIKLGGVATILANSLATLGNRVTYMGALGLGGVNPVFQDFANMAEEVISFSDPGVSDALEFTDGKVISSQLEPLKVVSWENLLEATTLEHLVEVFDRADLVAFADWTLLINVGSIWDGIAEEVLPKMTNRERRMMFFDLSDPTKRTTEDVLGVMATIRKYEEFFDTTLGLNKKEAYEVASRYGAAKDDFADLHELARFLREKVGISEIVIHPVDGAVLSNAREDVAVDGPYCADPTLTTGGGDNFNSGFLTGRSLGLTSEESLLLGVANSGFYVRAGRSPAFDELREFLVRWARGEID